MPMYSCEIAKSGNLLIRMGNSKKAGICLYIRIRMSTQAMRVRSTFCLFWLITWNANSMLRRNKTDALACPRDVGCWTLGVVLNQTMYTSYAYNNRTRSVCIRASTRRNRHCHHAGYCSDPDPVHFVCLEEQNKVCMHQCVHAMGQTLPPRWVLFWSRPCTPRVLLSNWKRSVRITVSMRLATGRHFNHDRCCSGLTRTRVLTCLRETEQLQQGLNLMVHTRQLQQGRNLMAHTRRLQQGRNLMVHTTVSTRLSTATTSTFDVLTDPDRHKSRAYEG